MTLRMLAMEHVYCRLIRQHTYRRVLGTSNLKHGAEMYVCKRCGHVGWQVDP